MATNKVVGYYIAKRERRADSYIVALLLDLQHLLYIRDVYQSIDRSMSSLIQIQQQVRATGDYRYGFAGITTRRQRMQRVGQILRSQILLPKAHIYERYLGPAGTYR